MSFVYVPNLQKTSISSRLTFQFCACGAYCLDCDTSDTTDCHLFTHSRRAGCAAHIQTHAQTLSMLLST